MSSREFDRHMAAVWAFRVQRDQHVEEGGSVEDIRYYELSRAMVDGMQKAERALRDYNHRMRCWMARVVSFFSRFLNPFHEEESRLET
jgi:hypothetical protein